MLSYRHLTIRGKLLALIMAVTSLALILASGSFLLYDDYVFRQTRTAEIETIASILASSSTTSLAVDDEY